MVLTVDNFGDDADDGVDDGDGDDDDDVQEQLHILRRGDRG